MEIMIRSGSIKKRKFRIYSNNLEEIEYLSKKYGIPEERLIYQAILSPKVKDNHTEDLNTLNEEINALLKEMFRLESEWAGLRYRAYLYIKENRGYAISLAGELARNKNMRNIMRIKREHEEMSDLIDKYLWL